MSAAFPDITPHHSSVSPLLADAVNDNLAYFSKLNKLLLELIQKVASIHEEAASSINSVVENFKKKVGETNKVKPNCQSESYQKFITRVFEQMENQAKILQTVSCSFSDCVVTPLQGTIEKKKEIWKTCFIYVNSFQHQIRKKEEDLLKRYKDYSDAANKLKTVQEGRSNQKQQLMYHNSHNTYLLRLSSVNSMNSLLYTHVLPYVVHSIEQNQAEMNDSLRHHIKYMFSVQKETLKKIGKSVDKIDHATDKIDLVADLNKFVKSMKGQVKDKHPPQQIFAAPRIEQNKRMSVAVDILESTFVLNKLTQPNLQRRLAALQHQTGELVDNIASMRAGETKEATPLKQESDPALEDLIELLSICDKEANLNVLLKQMELYTSRVTDFLGPIPMNLVSERKHSVKSPSHQPYNKDAGQNPHEFIQSRLVKPSQCFYCHKLITTFVKGFLCKSCKMAVHKKCATNVPFCDGVDVRLTRSNSTTSIPPSPMFVPKAESAEVYDLIDLEIDDDLYDYFDEDEFDDDFSDDDDDDDHETTKQLTSPVFQNPLNLIVLQKSLPKEPMQNIPSYQTGHVLPKLPALPKSINPQPPVLPLKPSNSTVTKTKPNISQHKPTLKPALSSKPVISKKPSLAQKPSLPPPVSRPTNCVAVYDYHSSQPSDLAFSSGSIIEILERSDADWWKGRCNNFEGYFPCSYVLELNKDAQILKALYSFTGQDPKELSVDEGQILILVGQEDDWLKVKSINSEGLVPNSYVDYI